MLTPSDVHHSVVLSVADSGYEAGTVGLLMYLDSASAVVEIDRPGGTPDIIWVDRDHVSPADPESRAA